MSYFKNIKLIFNIFKEGTKLVKETKRQQERYRTMSTDELALLPDDALYSAVYSRIEDKMDYADQEKSYSVLSQPQKVVYALHILEDEVNNGGLCQFFVNSSRMYAPYISEYLALICAEEHRNLFDSFIEKYKIDVHNLDSFRIQRTEDYEQQTQRYPFDEFDEAFYALPSLEQPSCIYIRENISFF